MAELSITQIVRRTEELKEKYRNNYGNGFQYRIDVQYTTGEIETFTGRNNIRNKEQCAADFDRRLDSVLDTRDEYRKVARLTVMAWKPGYEKGGYLINQTLELIPQYEIRKPVAVRVERQENETARNAEKVNDTPFGTVKGIINLLGLGGFAGEGLNGTEDAQFGGLGAVLAIRDNMTRKMFEDEQKATRYAEMNAENAGYKQRIEELKRENERLQGELDNAEDQLADYEEELEALRPLKNRQQLFGAVGASVAEALLVKHAKGIGGLFGIDEQTVKNALAGAGVETPTPQADKAELPSVEVDATEMTNEEKAVEDIRTIARGMSQKNPKAFRDLCEVMMFFSKQPERIADCVVYLKGQAAD